MRKIMIGFVAVIFAMPLFARPYLYVSHDKIKQLTVIDTAVNEVIRDIPLKIMPKDIKLDPENKFLYILSYDYNGLYRIHTKNLAFDRNYVSVGYAPVTMAISPDGKKMFVANSKSGNISVVALPGMDVGQNPIDLPGAPRSVLITDDNEKAFVAMEGRNGLAVIDVKTNKLSKTILTGADPWGMVIDGNKLFISNEGMSSISVVDIRKGKVLNEFVTSDSPRGLASYRNLVFTAVLRGIDIFETKRYEKHAAMGLDYETYDCELGKTSSGDRIYIAGYDKAAKTGKVAVIDPAINDIVKEIDVEGKPYYLEMKRKWPTPVPTDTYTPLPTNTPLPTETYTPVPTNTPVPKPTKKPTPKPKKKIKPKPTVKPKPGLITSELSGRVFMGNAPVKGVRIKAISKHRNKIYNVKTDANGRFTFKKLPIGGYTISVEASYIKEKSVAVVVNKGKNRPLVINVKKR